MFFFTHRSFQVCCDWHPLLIFDQVSIASIKQYSRSHNASRTLSLPSAPANATACIRNLSRVSLFVILRTCLHFASPSNKSVAFSANSTSESQLPCHPVPSSDWPSIGNTSLRQARLSPSSQKQTRRTSGSSVARKKISADWKLIARSVLASPSQRIRWLRNSRSAILLRLSVAMLSARLGT